MKHLIPVAVLALALSPVPPAEARRKSLEDQLMKLEPESRAIELCNSHASGEAAREGKLKKPDSVVASAFDEAIYQDDEVIASGAAIRAHGTWYRLTYRCLTSPDGLNVTKFEYRLGDPVPRDEWEDHSLF